MENKRIGMITFHGNNYGAVFQAFALQRYIRDHISSDVEIINLRTKFHIDFNHNVFEKLTGNPIKWFIVFILTLLRYRAIKRKQYRFELFRKQNLKFGIAVFYDDESLIQNVPPKDYYLTGSDQVFNPNSDLYRVYYLGFDKGDGKKVAYAPSFGISKFDSIIADKIKGLLNDYDSLSCREEQGAIFMSSLLNRDVPVVLDPTFLLTKQQWDDVAIHDAKNKGCIFVYDLNGGYRLLRIAYKLKSKTGKKIVCCTSKVRNFYKDADVVDFSIGPGEMLGYIEDADFVVTDSFHGTALSLVMGTKVLSYIALPSMASRLTTIMGALNLEEQLLSEKDLDKDFLSIDFKPYDDKLNMLREKSVEYLTKALN
jgi:hypothetical protein